MGTKAHSETTMMPHLGCGLMYEMQVRAHHVPHHSDTVVATMMQVASERGCGSSAWALAPDRPLKAAVSVSMRRE